MSHEASTGGYEATIEKPVCYRGVGLHTGKEVTMRLLPAKEGTGIVFVRRDLDGNPTVRACLANVVDATRSTTICSGVAVVGTVEHLLAGMRGLGVDNCIVELDGPEVPMGDGSAAEFVRLIREAHVMPQDSTRKRLVLSRPVWVGDEERLMLALPWDGLKVGFIFVSPYPHVGVQHVEFSVDEPTFCREIAPARTVAFLEEVESLRRSGLGLGGVPENLVLVARDSYAGPLRFPDEIARHKALDMIGDMALMGHVLAYIIGVRSNHRMNHRLARMMLEAVKS